MNLFIPKIKNGTELTSDGRYACIPKGTVCKVSENKNGFPVVQCSDGFHRIGTLIRDSDKIVGFSQPSDSKDRIISSAIITIIGIMVIALIGIPQ